jgi:DNA (cytosine-5)-methyltransferase 1
MRPRLLDLFCGAGGAAMGYHRAGFDVVGVDIKPQPHYPCEFHQADALTFPLGDFDAIHASPPCQEYSALRALTPDRHYPDLIAATRDRLVRSGLPWLIENVMPAPLQSGITLCGGMFGLRTYRHRRFETSWLIFAPEHPPHVAKTSTFKRPKQFAEGYHISVTGDVGAWVGPAVMGIDWMTGNELSQAIPPAYTEWLGTQLLAALEIAA